MADQQDRKQQNGEGNEAHSSLDNQARTRFSHGTVDDHHSETAPGLSGAMNSGPSFWTVHQGKIMLGAIVVPILLIISTYF